MRPEEIDLGYAPRRRSDVVAVEVDGELIVFDPRSKGTHKLNRLGALLWEVMDGTSTLAELSEDLAAVFAQPPSAIQGEVVAFVRALGEVGLLDEVRPTDERGEEPAGHAGESPARRP
jgi:hypothetical protein